jgi:tetratricopeptide (TPR) repeat protein
MNRCTIAATAHEGCLRRPSNSENLNLIQWRLSYAVRVDLSAWSGFRSSQNLSVHSEREPSLAEAYTALGLVKSHYDFDFPGAEKAFLKAIELNPSLANAYLFYSNCYLLPMGRGAEAVAANKKALELDPLSIPINNFVGAMYAYTGNDEKSDEQFQHTIKMEPSFPLAHAWLSDLLAMQGKYKEAIQEFQKSQLLSGVDPAEAAKEAARRLDAFDKGGQKGYQKYLLEEMLQAE